MSTPNTIQCPNCGTQIDIDEIFYHQIEEKFKQQQIEERQKLQVEMDEARKKYKSHLDALKAKEEALREEK